MAKSQTKSTKKTGATKKALRTDSVTKDVPPLIGSKMIIESGVLLQGDGDIWIYEKPKVWVSLDISLKNSDGTYNRMTMGVSLPVADTQTKTLFAESGRISKILKERIARELLDLQG